MFAGLPGIGVGTLFYVLMALWLPVRELFRLAAGTSSLERWRQIVIQWCHAVGIVASVVLAERVLLWILGVTPGYSVDLGAKINRELAGLLPASVFAAPVAASLILLAAVLVSVQVGRLVTVARRPAGERRGAPLAADAWETP